MDPNYWHTHGSSPWQPAADIYRGSQSWVIKFDLAGIAVEDISIQLHEGVLTVAGMRHDELVREAHQTYSMEIAYNRFVRSITLPAIPPGTKIDTEYLNGMLIVRLWLPKEV